ncbi:MAG: hypothetical protein QE274_03740 [Verrucomicrobiaceae bacterium]|jgi:hypothetical protein|nr:hypothetical protein [Verrucomicrobiaceae bacterium]
MSTALEIEKAIETLPPEELSKLREWFAEREATLAASASMFELYDSEEAEAQQWED